ncbi:cytochrome P450 [Xanthomonas hyacinthi]|uniref:cytochrome P450 n=1 Tax=Xanthomonas hyacinthi TaxID=56455 RepID=UPI000A3FB6B5|nr:cytochrome P450 [Xanthomonas hyacinthi]QGY78372.1 cytochrome P450 [Xanthomonas hyacinthi]
MDNKKKVRDEEVMLSGPATDLDIFDDAVLLDPYETYGQLRDLGGAVWSLRHRAWMLPRFAEVKRALEDHGTFISGEGVGLYPPAVEALQGTVIASDPPDHTPLRRVISARMSLRGLRAMEAQVQEAADVLIDKLVARRHIDAITELAAGFPLMIVADLIGLPENERDDLLNWADAVFNTFGPENERTLCAWDKFGALWEYIGRLDKNPEILRPGSMGREIYEAAERGEIRPEQAGRLMSAFLAAGLDTTIASIGNFVWLFGRHPETWDSVRANPASIPHAFNEVLRFESPVLAFRRTVAREITIDGCQLRQGDKVLILYASANRDGRYWDRPDEFDVARRPSEHLAFGFGIHNCAGQGLARLEAHAIMTALARKVRRFEVGTPRRHLNNVVRSFESLPVELIPA